MAELFRKSKFSEVYQRNIVEMPDIVKDIVLKYVKEKLSVFDLVVDAGCGTGKSTRPLAPHFHKVIGFDISESQINEARKHTSEENISYHVWSADNIPLEDASVDLVHAGLAVHFFNIDNFIKEAARILKPGGCLTIYALTPTFALQYKDKSEILTTTYCEDFSFLCNYEDKDINGFLRTQYKEIFEAVPFSDKQWIPHITALFPLSIKELVDFTTAMYMYEEFKNRNKDEALTFLKNLEKRLLDALGEPAEGVIVDFTIKYCCVLACKP